MSLYVIMLGMWAYIVIGGVLVLDLITLKKCFFHNTTLGIFIPPVKSIRYIILSIFSGDQITNFYKRSFYGDVYIPCFQKMMNQCNIILANRNPYINILKNKWKSTESRGYTNTVIMSIIVTPILTTIRTFGFL
jgi:hypothetical protein